MDDYKYRVKITLEKVRPGTLDLIGERWVEFDEDISRKLAPLPDDREIMELMSDKSPTAWMHHERIKNQIDDRRDATRYVSRRLLDQMDFLIKSQDKVNGYEQD